MTNKRHALEGWLASLPQPSQAPAQHPAPSPTPSPAAAHEEIPLAMREVLSIAPAHLAQLPLATTLLLRMHGADGGELWLWATSGRAIHAALVAEGSPVITARELTVLAQGAEGGRASRDVLLGWLQTGGPVGRSVPIEAVAHGGAYALEMPSRYWPLGKVLDAWGLTAVGLSVGDGPDCEVLV